MEQEDAPVDVVLTGRDAGAGLAVLNGVALACHPAVRHVTLVTSKCPRLLTADAMQFFDRLRHESALTVRSDDSEGPALAWCPWRPHPQRAASPATPALTTVVASIETVHGGKVPAKMEWFTNPANPGSLGGLQAAVTCMGLPAVAFFCPWSCLFFYGIGGCLLGILLRLASAAVLSPGTHDNKQPLIVNVSAAQVQKALGVVDPQAGLAGVARALSRHCRQE